MDQRQKSEYQGFSWHSLQDQNSIVYFAVTHKDFPDDICSRFLKQITNQLYQNEADFKKDPQNVISLSQNARISIHELHSKYQDHKNLDKTIVAQSTLEKVTGMMKQNIGKIIDNRNEFNDLENKSGNLKDTASRFRMNSAKLEQQAKWRNLRMKLIILAMIVLLTITIFWLVY
ncbi:r-snare vamp72-family [Stylonychia lemnae]|uniref:R-snare vamp72-family n=1 Tax=Stylonychia lemnae TaxID=5949 RepID=A0A078AWD3_STYLE|nr:r-snare vamp72-family [Stylonychia lemnae]|eukprot:CDW86454.1 r-snare vamp72-family [Stylonychia lemnae]